MRDQRVQFRVWPALAVAAWVLTVALILTAAMMENLYVAHAGLAMSAAAATLTIRCFICYQTRMMKSAFDYGREVGSEEASGPDAPVRLPTQPRTPAGRQ